MKIEGWHQTLSAGPLIMIAVAAVAMLLLLIMKLKVHAFPALIVVSALTAMVTVPLNHVVEVMLDGFGETLSSVALLVGIGAMFGALLETSGGAQVLANKLVSVVGPRRAPLALGIASLLFGFPIFFDPGLVIMLPIVFSMARRVGGPMLLYGLPAVGAFSVMHVFVPPAPGPSDSSNRF